MSEYTSQLTILRHFPKIFSMIHMPPKAIANAGCDTTLIFFFGKMIFIVCEQKNRQKNTNKCYIQHT